jgi:3'-phosphoadenosine 5'-phosphosulfate sulfotransferase (PAPS reductase)/FAD synthetase
MERDYHVVSFSGGKDSTAMLLHMLELRMPVDEIIFCDTGVEFPAMYEHLDKVEQYIGRKITRLKWEHTYEYYLCDIPVKRRASRYKRLLARGEELKLNTTGYSFAGARSRWCTSMKISAFNRHTKGKNLVRYIGIAADEPKRIGEFNYPLVEWGWTEADCLQYCYDKGFDWNGLYKIFSRVSCWCCPLQPLSEARKLRHNFPELWATLLDWQHRTWRKFRADYSVDELEAKFATEDEMEKRQVKLF